MSLAIMVPFPEHRLVGVTRASLWASCVEAPADAAKFRFVIGSGARDHFEIPSAALVELGPDRQVRARHPKTIVHRVLGGRIGVFWHGEPRPGVYFAGGAAHAWDLATGAALWTLPGSMVALGERLALGRVGATGYGAEHRITYAVIEVATGARRLELEGLEVVAMAEDGVRVYVMDRGRSVSAYRLADGAHVWTHADEAARPSLTSFGLALGDGCAWYAAAGAVVGLDLETGAVAARHPMTESIVDVLALPHGVVTVRETRLDRVDRAGVTRLANVAMADRRVLTNGRWIVCATHEGVTKDLVAVTPAGAVTYVKLTATAATVLLDADALLLGEATRCVIVPLDELGDLARTTLALEDGAVIGKRAPLPKVAASAAATRLFGALAAQGLLPALPAAERTRLLLELFGRGPLDASATYRLLQAGWSDEDAIRRGVIIHDWRFGQETSDVIAEFDRALDVGPVRFAQLASTRERFAMRVTRGATVQDVEFPADVTLGDIAARIDGVLAQAGAPRRVHALETDGDEFAFLVVEPRVIEALRAAKVPGLPARAR